MWTSADCLLCLFKEISDTGDTYRFIGVFSNSLFFYFRICFKYIHGGVVKVYIYYRIVFYFLNIDSVSEDHISAFPPFEIRLLLH